MKREDFRKRATENFEHMLPLINRLLNKVKLSNNIQEYEVRGSRFLIRLNEDIVEMSLADERSIFPTLAFRPINDSKADLLYFRIRNEFNNKLHNAVL